MRAARRAAIADNSGVEDRPTFSHSSSTVFAASSMRRSRASSSTATNSKVGMFSVTSPFPPCRDDSSERGSARSDDVPLQPFGLVAGVGRNLEHVCQPTPRVLDVGAGTGKLTSLLVSRFNRVIAVEPVEAMRGPASEALPGGRNTRGNRPGDPGPRHLGRRHLRGASLPLVRRRARARRAPASCARAARSS